MDALTTEILVAAYIVSNALRVLSYVPQIVCVARDEGGARSISLTTWSLWTTSNAATGVYALLIVSDLFLSLVSAANALGCATVAAMVIVKRAKSFQPRLAAAAESVMPPGK